jgi:LAO/AO transport system kinase
MEIADIFVINKSDLDGTDRLEQDIRGVLGLRDDLGFASGDGSSGHPGSPGCRKKAEKMRPLAPEAETAPTTRGQPPIVRTVATRAEGVEELFATVGRYLDFAREHGTLQQRRQDHWRARLLAMLREKALERVVPQALSDGVLDRHAAAVAAREMDPYSVADQILKQAGSPGESW